MRQVWVRPATAEDVPLIRQWLEATPGTPFSTEQAMAGQVLCVYDDDGPIAFAPFWVSYTLGCPLERPGVADARLAEALAAGLRQVAFMAHSQRVPEINAAATTDAGEKFLAQQGFRDAGKFMRWRR